MTTLELISPGASARLLSSFQPWSGERLTRAKWAYTTRRVPAQSAAGLCVRGVPNPGDVVLARVVRLGKHQGLELQSGRKAQMFPGDEIVVCYGHRYAPDQFEATVPMDLSACHLVAAGGIAARALSWHEKVGAPTAIEPLGFITDSESRRLNLSQFAVETAEARSLPPLIIVAGTAMNAGKTTTAAHLIRAATGAGLRTAAAKLTGTGAGGDVYCFADAGAHPVLDFTDAGVASTWKLSTEALEGIWKTLLSQLGREQPDLIVCEIADGLFQEETAAMLRSNDFRDVVSGVVFAANDASGAAYGCRWLAEAGHRVLAVSGTLTASPLALRETEVATGLPVHGLADLAEPATLASLLDACRVPLERVSCVHAS